MPANDNKQRNMDAQSTSANYCSLGSLLEELRSLFPTTLLDATGWEKLQALARRLPSYFSDSRFGFEFDLSAPEPVADFFVRASPGTRLGEFYQLQSERAACDLVSDSFGPFSREQTSDPQSFLARRSSGIILEYDLAGSPPGQHGAPRIFISPRGTPEQANFVGRLDLDELVATLYSAAGRERDPAEIRRMEQVWEALEGAGLFIHYGILPGRARAPFRFVTGGVDSARVPGVLERLQWPGDLALVRSVLSQVSGLVTPRAGISIDVSAQGVSPRIGLELFRSAEWFLYRLDRAGWKSLIDVLEGMGWCRPDKAAGLVQLPRLETFFGLDGVYQVRHYINHVKLVIDRDDVSTKAYSGMDVRPAAV